MTCHGDERTLILPGGGFSQCIPIVSRVKIHEMNTNDNQNDNNNHL